MQADTENLSHGSRAKELRGTNHRSRLQEIARRVMVERGLLPDFDPTALAELGGIHGPAAETADDIKDLRSLLWCSIDNDDTRDLDQLTASSSLPDGAVKILVAIADVDALVGKQSAIDIHAGHNTTSVYTPARIFPMIPEILSTDYTSLNDGADRLAVVIEFVITADGSLGETGIYRATVRNHAKLAYNSLAAWLDGGGTMPQEIGAVKGLEESLRLQDGAAGKMKVLRHLHGALDLETIESHPVFEGDAVVELKTEGKNRAKGIIEDFMIAANGITARYLASKNHSSIRRVVRTPKRWDRIVEIAEGYNFMLPRDPDSKLLDEFLISARTSDPLRYPDLSLSIIKLLGPGEYVVQLPEGNGVGHFGLAVRDYAHSTAPNRRYPDLLMQRMLKSAISDRPQPYSNNDLKALASHCTAQEDAAKKVERQLEKSAAAIVLESRIGDEFDAVVTGASPKGNWVRIFDPPVEGRLIIGSPAIDVGHRFRVRLMRTDVDMGYIDFTEV